MRALALLLVASGAVALGCGPDEPVSGDTGGAAGYAKPAAPAATPERAPAPLAEAPPPEAVPPEPRPPEASGAIALARVVATGSDGFLTLRESPESRGRVVEMPHRQAVRVLGCRDEAVRLEGATGAWCRVRVAPEEGWLFDAFLASGGPETHTVSARTFLALRTQPSVSRGRQTLRLLPGTPVTVSECRAMEVVEDERGRWCRARVGAMEGWAFGGFLERVGA